ncbi:histidine phosphatase family protein [Fibrobacter sp.]|uniref:histidine phosphatase family protein n=1 Tax=Fibrobacter sp. TaxID=35828 RepID=UPI0026355D4A|nr:histidine phosphatase family protein [Fibrobacter sp.]MDD5941783.1 histidine phosphatase family protein [Fibrobacter sp.]
MKLKNLLVLAVPAFFWAACSSDSESTPAQPPVPTEISSASTVDPSVPAEPSDPANPAIPGIESSASVDGVPLSSDAGSDPVDPAVPFVPEELVYDSIGFADIANAFHTVAPDEKVVFVLRHAERESGVGRETPLTENGILQAQSVGQKLISADEFVYAHTAYVRTKETACNIALGRGQVQVCDDSFVSDTISELTGGWFIKDEDLRDSYVSSTGKDTNTSVIVSLWAYDGQFADAFYDLEERSLEVINTYLIKDYAEMPKAKVVISHDEFVVPLIAWATNKTASIRYKWGRWWVNYLTGLAIIVNGMNEVRYIGIKGLETATE